MGGRRQERADTGQVLVLFALSIIVLLGATGIAIDGGRLYSERRFLQNAADAAALAAANALIRGGSIADAEAEARAVLARNYTGAPNGITAPLPPSSPVYESGFAGDPRFLIDGIVISGGDVRVAVRNWVPYTFGRAVGLDTTEVGARARVKLDGNLLPIAVRRYVNAPGPNAGATAPCPDNQNAFLDFFATASTACLGSETDGVLRNAPSAGWAFNPSNPGDDPASHGPVVAILGQGAQPSNGADFRGFVALDVRNYATDSSRVYYNGVAENTNANTLKSMEANWILAGGYPGPMFPSVVSPPDPNDQVGIMSGNSTGIAIDAVNARFAPGDEILVAVYPGHVMAIPDFAIAPPTEIGLPTTGTVPTAGSLKVSRNQAFSGQVELSIHADAGDPLNPLGLGTLVGGDAAVTFAPNPVTPTLGSGTSVAMTNLVTSGAAPGIYGLWVKGKAGSPYLTEKDEPMALKIGTVTRDFTITADAQAKEAPIAGDVVAFNLTLQNAPSKTTAFGGPVTLSLDGPPPAGLATAAFASTTVTPTQHGASTTLSISTGTMAPGAHDFVVRAAGLNGDATPRPVTHLLKLTVHVAPAGSKNDDYVDIVGFAVMRIAASGSNTISAYAITPVIPDMNDDRLRRGQVARLVPWT